MINPVNPVLTMGPFGTRFDRSHCTPSALRRITDYIKQR